MTPTQFPEQNIIFRPPTGYAESQVMSIYAHLTEAKSGSVDGDKIVVVAWQPNEIDLERLRNGAPIFLSVLGGLPPHFLTTDFKEAVNPA